MCRYGPLPPSHNKIAFGVTVGYVILDTVLFLTFLAGVAAILLSMDDTMTPSEVKNALLNRAIMGAVSDPGAESPNLLLYVGSGDGPNTPPPEPGS